MQVGDLKATDIRVWFLISEIVTFLEDAEIKHSNTNFNNLANNEHGAP